jgi:hypothetical protein
LASIEGDGVIADPVEVAVLPREDDGPAGCADPVCAEAIIEAAAFAGDPVDSRRPVKTAPITADRLGGMVIGHDEEDIGASNGPADPKTAPGQGKGQRGQAG